VETGKVSQAPRHPQARTAVSETWKEGAKAGKVGLCCRQDGERLPCLPACSTIGDPIRLLFRRTGLPLASQASERPAVGLTRLPPLDLTLAGPPLPFIPAAAPMGSRQIRSAWPPAWRAWLKPCAAFALPSLHPLRLRSGPTEPGLPAQRPPHPSTAPPRHKPLSPAPMAPSPLNRCSAGRVLPVRRPWLIAWPPLRSATAQVVRPPRQNRSP